MIQALGNQPDTGTWLGPLANARPIPWSRQWHYLGCKIFLPENKI